MSTVLSHNTAKAPLPVYLATTVVVFFCSLSVADSLDFVPYYLDGSEPAASQTKEQDNASVTLSDLPQLGAGQSPSTPTTAPVVEKVLPVRLKISSIGLDLPVQNVTSHDIATLDGALKDGPVRYVDSAQLNEEGNMLIFAHSSHLPIVHNQMYKAFNRISELKESDTIAVVGKDGKDYLYAVTSVRKTDANEAVIDLSTTHGTKLTLSTCDTVTSKSSRFVVEAEFVGVAN